MSFRRPTLTVAYNYVCAVSVVFTPTPTMSKCVKTNTSLVCQFKSFFLSCVSAQCRFEVMPTFLFAVESRDGKRSYYGQCLCTLLDRSRLQFNILLFYSQKLRDLSLLGVGVELYNRLGERTNA